jgi:transcription initiation factor IIE alpha subunit
MLDVLLATMSFIAAMSMFFLCWLGWTMNKQLEHNDNVINELQDEIDRLTKIINKNQKELFEEYNQ